MSAPAASAAEVVELDADLPRCAHVICVDTSPARACARPRPRSPGPVIVVEDEDGPPPRAQDGGDDDVVLVEPTVAALQEPDPGRRAPAELAHSRRLDLIFDEGSAAAQRHPPVDDVSHVPRARPSSSQAPQPRDVLHTHHTHHTHHLHHLHHPHPDRHAHQGHRGHHAHHQVHLQYHQLNQAMLGQAQVPRHAPAPRIGRTVWHTASTAGASRASGGGRASSANRASSAASSATRAPSAAARAGPSGSRAGGSSSRASPSTVAGRRSLPALAARAPPSVRQRSRNPRAPSQALSHVAHQAAAHHAMHIGNLMHAVHGGHGAYVHGLGVFDTGVQLPHATHQQIRQHVMQYLNGFHANVEFLVMQEGSEQAMDYDSLIRLDDQLLRERNRAGEEEISAIPMHIATQADTEVRCCVCMCDVEVGEELRTLSCSHKYHRACIDRTFADFLFANGA